MTIRSPLAFLCGRVSALAIAVALAYSPSAWADPIGPQPNAREIASSVAKLLKLEHLSHRALDRETSERCLKLFLKSLDPWKVYFYQSDVDEFMQYKDGLCQAIDKGDVTFAYRVFRVFLQRVDERIQMVDKLLAMPHDFTVDEEMATDRDEVRYPRDPAEAFDRWRKRIKYDLLDLKASQREKQKDQAKEPDGAKEPETGAGAAPPAQTDAATPEDEDREARKKIARRYHSFAKRMHQYDDSELLEMYLNAFTRAFDPHSDYMSVKTQKNFDILMSLKLEGIGAELRSEDGHTVVRRVVPGGAAAKDGRLKAEDKIVGVGQNAEGEMIDVVDMKLSDVVELIRGPRGTTVRLEVIPAAGTERKIYTIVREKIELKDEEARGAVFEAGRKPDGAPYRVGVIDLPSFYRDIEAEKRGDPNFRSATRDVRRILGDFQRQAVDAVILDLRFNGGGSLPEAISLSGLFLREGPIVQVKDSEGGVSPYVDRDPSVAWSGPLVVLTNKFSASASEIVAGAIQDYRRGLIVGDRATHGKGTVQSLMDLAPRLFGFTINAQPMGALKITMQQFYRPAGDSTQKRGVLADVELPSLTAHFDAGEADLDYPVEFDRVNELPHADYGFVNDAVRERLRRLSAERVQHSEDFQKVIRNIARYKEQKMKKTVTLNEEKFLKERMELNADREEEKTVDQLTEKREGQIKRDYYLDEAIAITVDYLELCRGAANDSLLRVAN